MRSAFTHDAPAMACQVEGDVLTLMESGWSPSPRNEQDYLAQIDVLWLSLTARQQGDGCGKNRQGLYGKESFHSLIVV
jgi:hypothetical protein